ncbi:hypothetical protein B0H19DRAFT_981388 [Mycena capillaripes]|nr:hypothetical protein B0H19DRAFT_981388 [Mycena capillaripes]
MNSASSFNANTTLGAYQIGVLVSYVLFGVMTTQTYIYYSRFPEDSRKLKILVAFVWVCEVVLTVCLGHTLYTYTIFDYAHPERIAGAAPKSLSASLLVSWVVSVCVQGFFSFRIYALTKTVWIPAIIWVLAFLLLLGNVAATITALRMSSLPSYEMQYEWLLASNWSILTANDLIITGTLVTILIRRWTYAQKKTTLLVDKLILWSIETGMLTSASGIIALICFVEMKDNFVYVAFYAIEARVFSNSLLAALNSRAALRAMNEISLPPSMAPAIEFQSNSVQMTRVIHIISDHDSNHVNDKAASSSVEAV